MGKVLPFKQPDLIPPDLLRDLKRLSAIVNDKEKFLDYVRPQIKFTSAGEPIYGVVITDLGRLLLKGAEHG